MAKKGSFRSISTGILASSVCFLLDTKEVSILSSTGSKRIYRAVVSGQTGDNIEVLFYFGQ